MEPADKSVFQLEFNKNFRVSLPPLLEQHIIADFLDTQTAKLNTLVAKKRELIEKLKEKRAALISRTATRGLPPEAALTAGFNPYPKLKYSGIEWLSEIPEHWEAPPLYTRYRIGLGKMLDESRITGGHLVPYLRNVDVQWDTINTVDLPEMDIHEEKGRAGIGEIHEPASAREIFETVRQNSPTPPNSSPSIKG